MDVPEVATFITDSGATWEEVFCRKSFHLLRFNDSTTIWRSIKGYQGATDFVGDNSVRIDALKKIKTSNIRFNTKNQSQALEKVIDLVTKHNSKLVLLFVPQTDVLNWSRKDNVQKAIELFRNYEATNRNVIFLDYNRKYEHRLDIFADANHVNATGQQLVTNDLIHDLRTILDPLQK